MSEYTPTDDEVAALVRDRSRRVALGEIRVDELTPALVLLARGIRDVKHAAAIAKGLDLTRIPRGGEKALTLDALSLRCLRMHRGVLEEHGGDPIAMETALRAAGAFLDPFLSAKAIPVEWLKRAEGTRLLLEIVNTGHSNRWRLGENAKQRQRKPRLKTWEIGTDRASLEAVAV